VSSSLFHLHCGDCGHELDSGDLLLVFFFVGPPPGRLAGRPHAVESSTVAGSIDRSRQGERLSSTPSCMHAPPSGPHVRSKASSPVMPPSGPTRRCARPSSPCKILPASHRTHIPCRQDMQMDHMAGFHGFLQTATHSISIVRGFKVDPLVIQGRSRL
jgi:hypothetical protein